ncbi:hypothetical protein [Phenylobacterium deserti]|uniref:DUF2188 domain-containing protein n=1 Tax=Phenylobacterium deserti TaxID=1914756 RepID=A0A328AV25_9CAUL|nr:hypothetical protein [Phenylobacterium deserti]RAK58055.1 hypothetical protein DJ018_09140 [Phenylobacterium deserti]
MARTTIRTFTAAQLKGVWSVTQNGAFYGDYQSREQAVAGARAGARAVEERGGAACVLVGEARLVAPH